MNQSLLDRAKKAGVLLVFYSRMWEHGANGNRMAKRGWP